MKLVSFLLLVLAVIDCARANDESVIVLPLGTKVRSWLRFPHVLCSPNHILNPLFPSILKSHRKFNECLVQIQRMTMSTMKTVWNASALLLIEDEYSVLMARPAIALITVKEVLPAIRLPGAEAARARRLKVREKNHPSRVAREKNRQSQKNRPSQKSCPSQKNHPSQKNRPSRMARANILTSRKAKEKSPPKDMVKGHQVVKATMRILNLPVPMTIFATIAT
jgi:hypothetical protein